MEQGCIGRACRYVPSIDHPKRSSLTGFGRYSLLANLDRFALTRYETHLRGVRTERSFTLNTTTATSLPHIPPAASSPGHAFAVSASQSQRAAQTVPELGEPRARRTTETAHALYVSLFTISTVRYCASYSDVHLTYVSPPLGFCAPTSELELMPQLSAAPRPPAMEFRLPGRHPHTRHGNGRAAKMPETAGKVKAGEPY